MKTSYIKLTTGECGVLCDERPAVGDVVTVTKRDGTTKQETIAQVFTRGDKCARMARYELSFG